MNKNLIISTVGDESLHNQWISNPNSNFDTVLIYYGDKKPFSSEPNRYNRKGAKFPLVLDIIEENPHLLNYEYIWLPDDDISIYPEEISMLFYFAKKYDLWICQPSLMGWYGVSPTLHQQNSHIRFTNYVEVMCPCFSSSILKKCKSTFKENNSCWGIDSLWNVMLKHPTDKLAIIDDVIAIHTRPIGGGDMYKNHSQGLIENAMNEAKDIYYKYNLEFENYEDLKNGHPVSQELFGTLAYSIVEYSRIYKSNEAGVPVSDRVWPPNQETRQLCEHIRKHKHQGMIAVL